MSVWADSDRLQRGDWFAQVLQTPGPVWSRGRQTMQTNDSTEVRSDDCIEEQPTDWPAVPSALSELQRFLLAFATDTTDGEAHYFRLRNAVVEEFPTYAPDSPRGRQPHTISDQGLAVLSRSIRRLADHGLLTRHSRSGEPVSGAFPATQTQRISLTADGRAIGEELLRRHHDGRYALEFDTIEE